MKKILCLSVLPLLALTSCGKSNTNVKKETTYDKDNSVVETIDYEYNSNGLLIHKTFEDDMGKTRYSYSYNDKKLLEKEVYEFEVDGEYVGAYYDYYVYDEKDNCILEANYDYDSILDYFALSSITNNEYNSKNLITSCTYISYLDKDVVTYTKQEWEYDDQDRVISELDIDLETGYYAFKNYTAYSEDGLTAITSQYDNDDNLIIVTTDNYDANKNLLKSVVKGKDGLLRASYEYTYNDKGQVLSEHHIGVSLDIDAMTRYEYDGKDRLIKTSYFDIVNEVETLNKYMVSEY